MLPSVSNSFTLYLNVYVISLISRFFLALNKFVYLPTTVERIASADIVA